MMNFGGGGQYDALLQEIMRQQQARAQRQPQAQQQPMGGTMQSAPVNIPQYQGGGQPAGGGAAAGMSALANPQTIAAMMKMWGGGGADFAGSGAPSAAMSIGNDFGGAVPNYSFQGR